MPVSPRATRAALPAPRPLSPRAAAFVRSVYAAEAERTRAVQNAVTSALGTVAKAKDKPQMTAVFDQAGKLVGIVDPANITPVANSEATPADGETQSVQASAAGGPDLGGAKPAPAAGVPVEDVTKTSRPGAVRKAMLATPDAVEQAALSNALTGAALTAITHVQRQRARSIAARRG